MNMGVVVLTVPPDVGAVIVGTFVWKQVTVTFLVVESIVKV
jgi:hypothetical protein